jgi:hypothetical protein
VVTARWRPLFPGARCDADILLQATHVRVLKSLAKPHAPPAMDAGFLFRWGICSYVNCVCISMCACICVCVCICGCSLCLRQQLCALSATMALYARV